MKTNSTLKLLKFSTLLPLVIALAALVTQSARANPLLVITELSSSNLTVTVSGSPYGTVQNVSPDVWVWTAPAPAGLTVIGDMLNSNRSWTEPLPGTGANATGFGPQLGQLKFTSDTSLPFFVSPDGAIITNFYTNTFSDFTQQTYDGQFIDLGDVATTPDTGSTLGLLVLALAGLFGARRIRSLWVA